MVGAKLGIGGVPTQQNNEKKTNRCFEIPHHKVEKHFFHSSTLSRVVKYKKRKIAIVFNIFKENRK